MSIRRTRLEPEKRDQESKEKTPEELNQEGDKQEEDSSKGMDSCDYNDILCDEIEKVLAEDDEGISKDAHEIHLTSLNIDLRAVWFLNTVNLNHSDFTKFKKKILDSLNEYQHKTMTMKLFLVKLKKEILDSLNEYKQKTTSMKVLLLKLKDKDIVVRSNERQGC